MSNVKNNASTAKIQEPEIFDNNKRCMLLGTMGFGTTALLQTLFSHEVHGQPSPDQTVASLKGILGGTPSAEESDNIQLVTSFCEAWERRDLNAVINHFTENFTYKMSQDNDPVSGSTAMHEIFDPWIEATHKITYKVLETFSRGPVVINHRIDIYHSKTMPLTWEGIGVFLISEGKIREWSDYTISIDRGPTPD
jgi:limonene-1,2-epoxide hydrolase